MHKLYIIGDSPIDFHIDKDYLENVVLIKISKLRLHSHQVLTSQQSLGLINEKKHSLRLQVFN